MSITKSELRGGHILEALLCTTMVLMPKFGMGYRCMGLVEVIWNVCAEIINTRLHDALTLHNALCSFRKWRGAGTVSIAAKMVQKFAGISNEPLFQVFIDMREA